MTLWNKELLLHKYFGWDPFLNKGVAFGIQIPRFVVVILTVFILTAVIYFFKLNERVSGGKNDTRLKLGLALIFAGAISNLFDRLIFNYTIDYIRILNGVINFADIFIVAGFVLYFSGLSEEAPKK
jgi:lipoprotein signal peptidase